MRVQSKLRNCVKVEVVVLGLPSPIVLMVSQCRRKAALNLNMCRQSMTKSTVNFVDIVFYVVTVFLSLEYPPVRDGSH